MTTNRSAILSLTAGSLTLLSLCAAVIPVPFTGYVCFPGAALWAIIAVVSGIRSMRQIRASGEEGRRLARAGLAIGGSTLLAGACLGALGMLLLPNLVEAGRQVLR